MSIIVLEINILTCRGGDCSALGRGKQRPYKVRISIFSTGTLDSTETE